jgi:hypothetical protein
VFSTQGFTLGYFIVAPLGLFFFLKPNPDKPEPNRVISEKLDDLQIALKPALGAAFSDSSKIFWQEMTRFHDEDTTPLIFTAIRY